MQSKASQPGLGGRGRAREGLPEFGLKKQVIDKRNGKRGHQVEGGHTTELDGQLDWRLKGPVEYLTRELESAGRRGAQISDHPGILGEKMGGAFPAPGQCCALVCIPEKVFPSVTWTVDECEARGEAGGPGNRQGWKEPGLGESGSGRETGEGG